MNTALQLILMGSTLLDPLIDMPMTQVLQLLQWVYAPEISLIDVSGGQ